MENKFIAVLPVSNFGGLGIISIEHGIEDKVTTAFDFGNGMENKSTAKIRESGIGSYFIKFGRRYYIKNFMRV